MSDKKINILFETELDDKALVAIRKKLGKIGVELEKISDSGKISFSKLEECAGKASDAMSVLSASAGDAAKTIVDLSGSISEVTDTVEALSSGVNETTEAMGSLSDGIKNAATAMGGLNDTASDTKDNIEQITDEAKKLEEGSSGTQKLINGFSDLKDAVTVAYSAVRKLISSAVEQRQTDAQQLVAIRNNTDEYTRQGKSIKGLADEFKSYANERQKLTGIDNSSTQRMQTTLLTMGTDPDLINRVTEAFQDMAAATGNNAEAMMQAWERINEAPDEAVDSLKRYGIQLSDLEKDQIKSMSADQRRIAILQRVEAAYKGQAQAMADASGGIMQAEAEFGSLVKTLGEGLLTALNPVIIALTAVISFLANAQQLILDKYLHNLQSKILVSTLDKKFNLW
jgi:chromosome segregation ATPase